MRATPTRSRGAAGASGSVGFRTDEKAFRLRVRGGGKSQRSLGGREARRASMRPVFFPQVREEPAITRCPPKTYLSKSAACPSHQKHNRDAPPHPHPRPPPMDWRRCAGRRASEELLHRRRSMLAWLGPESVVCVLGGGGLSQECAFGGEGLSQECA